MEGRVVCRATVDVEEEVDLGRIRGLVHGVVVHDDDSYHLVRGDTKCTSSCVQESP